MSAAQQDSENLLTERPGADFFLAPEEKDVDHVKRRQESLRRLCLCVSRAKAGQ